MRGNIRILMLCRVLWSFSTSIVDPYLSLFIIALGGSPAEIGLIASLGLIAGMVLYPMGGYIADRSGRVKLIGYSTVLYALTHIFFVIATDWRMVMIGQFTSQLLLFYMPAMNALEADSLPPRVRGQGFAIVMAVPSAVRVIAPVVGGYAIMWYQNNSGMTSGEALITAVRICWGIALLTGIFVAYLRLHYLKETITEEEMGEPFKFSQIPRMILPSYRSILGSIKWMSPSLKVIVAIEMFTAFFLAMSAPYYVVYVKTVIGLTEANWGLLLFISGLLGITVALPMGSLVDRLGQKKMILAGMFLVPFCIYGFIHSTGFYSVALIMCGVVLCNNIMIPAFSTLIANTIPRSRRGRLYSLIGERGISVNFGNFWGAGFLLFPPAALGAFAGGYVYSYSPSLLYTVTAAAMFIAFILVYLYVQEPSVVES